jgi:hypothetical protein
MSLARDHKYEKNLRLKYTANKVTEVIFDLEAVHLEIHS